ncbi:WG repeat-containing protein [Spirosoma arcticum]
MTETELTDRLREAIVLDGPDVWRSNGYLQDAQAAGLSLEVALKRATEVSQEVSNNSILFQNIQTRIARLAQPSRSHLVEQDLSQIVNAARSLKLSPDFVRNRWVPAELARLKASLAPSEAQQPPAVVVPPAPVVPVDEPRSFESLLETDVQPLRPASVEPLAPVATPKPAPELPKPPVFVPTPASTPLPAFVESTPLTGPPPVVRSFTATPARVRKGDTVTLDWEVENLLAVTIDDLGEGLSPKNRGWIKPSKTADYTLFDANDNPLSTVRVEVIQPDRSGLYGVLFALVLLGLIYWFIKNNNATPPPRQKPERQTERTTRRTSSISRSEKRREPDEDVAIDPSPSDPVKTIDAPVSAKTTEIEKTVEKSSVQQVQQPEPVVQAPAEPVVTPTTPADARIGKYEEAFGDKPYDKVELGADERGWRRARSNGRWGYINEADQWVIRPEYEAVTPFRGNTAAVFLNGQLMNINREGEQIRK